MFRKVMWIVALQAVVALAYLIMTATMPATNALISTANETLAASTNLSNYPGLQAAIESAPLWGYFIPAAADIFFTVLILKV